MEPKDRPELEGNWWKILQAQLNPLEKFAGQVGHNVVGGVGALPGAASAAYGAAEEGNRRLMEALAPHVRKGIGDIAALREQNQLTSAQPRQMRQLAREAPPVPSAVAPPIMNLGGPSYSDDERAMIAAFKQAQARQNAIREWDQFQYDRGFNPTTMRPFRPRELPVEEGYGPPAAPIGQDPRERIAMMIGEPVREDPFTAQLMEKLRALLGQGQIAPLPEYPDEGTPRHNPPAERPR